MFTFQERAGWLAELQYLSTLCKVRNASQKYSKTRCQVWFGGCSGLVWFSRHFTEDFSLPVCHSDQSKVVKIYISFPLQPILNIYKKSIIISASQKVSARKVMTLLFVQYPWMLHKYDVKEENNLKCVSYSLDCFI